MKFLAALTFFVYLIATIAALIVNHSFSRIIGDIAICGAVSVAFMICMFFMAEKIKRYDLVDAAWGTVFIVIALTAYLLQPGRILEFDIQTITTVLVLLWGGRLTYHILKRLESTDTEDARYVELRKTWKGNVRFNILTKIYLTQAIAALIISIPMIHINLFAGNKILPLAWVGVVVWIVGYYFEVVGDRQLRSFVTNPKNKGHLMTEGLWKYTRHPNYFGELTQWWGIFIISLSTAYGWVGIIGPVLITYLILFVSGIPLNEKRFEGREGWAEYKKKTSVFFPLPPRS